MSFTPLTVFVRQEKFKNLTPFATKKLHYSPQNYYNISYQKRFQKSLKIEPVSLLVIVNIFITFLLPSILQNNLFVQIMF